MHRFPVQIRARPINLESYHFFQDTYGFESFNRQRGLEITSDRSPDLRYHLEEGDINVYSYDPSFSDLLHPFRPSGEVVVEMKLMQGETRREMFLSGGMDNFHEMDAGVMKEIENYSAGDYYKEIL